MIIEQSVLHIRINIVLRQERNLCQLGSGSYLNLNLNNKRLRNLNINIQDNFQKFYNI